MERFARVMSIAILSTLGTLIAGVAAALPYAPAPTLSIVGCSDVDSGIAVQVTGLLPGSSVTISGPSGSKSKTANGSGSVSATLPSSNQGDYTVTANGADADGAAWSSTASVTVVKSCTSADSDVETAETVDTEAAPGLPKTGSDTGMLVSLGAAAILFGGAAVVAARTRRVSNGDEH